MYSKQFIISDIEPLNPQQTVKEAIEILHLLHLDILPLVKNKELLNYVPIETIEQYSLATLLSNVQRFSTVLPFISPEQHILDALTHLKTLNISLLSVLDEQNQYLGFVKTKDIVKGMSNSLTVKSHGSIVVIKMKAIDFSLADIVRIIEYNDAKVIGFFTFEIEETNDIEIHLKLNTSILRNVLATLERYDYHVIQYFNREDINDDNDLRYENLMKYLD